MTVDKSKQIHGWWIDADVDICCSCGEYIHFADSGEKECPNCGQRWRMVIEAERLEDEEVTQ